MTDPNTDVFAALRKSLDIRENAGASRAWVHHAICLLDGIVKDDEGRPYQCGAFVANDSRWECLLESDHEGEHQWMIASSVGIESLERRIEALESVEAP